MLIKRKLSHASICVFMMFVPGTPGVGWLVIILHFFYFLLIAATNTTAVFFIFINFKIVVVAVVYCYRKNEFWKTNSNSIDSFRVKLIDRKKNQDDSTTFYSITFITWKIKWSFCRFRINFWYVFMIKIFVYHQFYHSNPIPFICIGMIIAIVIILAIFFISTIGGQILFFLLLLLFAFFFLNFIWMNSSIFKFKKASLLSTNNQKKKLEKLLFLMCKYYRNLLPKR